MDDLRWFLKQLRDPEEFFRLNLRLLDATLAFDAFDRPREAAMPVHFISGSDDWICPVPSLHEYLSGLTAPAKSLDLIEGCGHQVQFERPEEFADLVKRILREENL